MILKFRPTNLTGVVNMPPSKSHLHRILIVSALSNRLTQVIGKSNAEDVLATISCLRSLGASITENSTGYLVNPIWNNLQNVALLDANESGSTFRFLIPIVAALNLKSCQITGSERLLERPILDLLHTLKSNNANIEFDQTGIYISSKLSAGRFLIRGDISSQYITGLLLACPLLDGDSEITITGKRQSQSYIDITIEVMQKFGIKVLTTSTGYYITGGQVYSSPYFIKAESDWSNAAFWLVAGALNGDIIVNGLNMSSTQGDRAILNILREAGANIFVAQNNAIHVKKSTLYPFNCDLSNIPDLGPILSILASSIDGECIFSNIERLRLKECDRIMAIEETLERLNVKTLTNTNTLTISGGSISSATLKGYNDHRMIMSAAVAGCLVPIILTGADAYKKSYPTFFDVYESLGGDYETVE
ncbi:MAG: 3-phosphoshikimate 1-carboxyvinyltransferase [Christensenellaceae bacterium]|jgi:3-phosphoshikimate 1-carboxyvinyltransferase|nr:3-phosphoshikimate 1-carboxyvinyltransferase [Christensenellaceae bacterium]